MSQKQIQLEVRPRDNGKAMSRRLRRERFVPAVVYGPKCENLNVAIHENEVQRYASHQYDNVIFRLSSADAKINGLPVLKKAAARHPVSRRFLHLDFFAVDMKEAVRVHVEIHFDGKAQGVRDGGVMNILRRDIEIECLPDAIPDAVHVDVTNLQLNEALHVSDLKLPSGVKLITGADEAIVSVAEVSEEKPAEVVAESAAAAAPAAEAAKSSDKK